MKRYVVLAVMFFALAVAGVFGSAQAAEPSDFAGKWIGYKVVVKQGDQTQEMNFEQMMGSQFSEENTGSIEFDDDDETVTIAMSPGSDPEERDYKADGDKLIVETTEDDGEDVKSAEILMENGELLFVIVTKDATMTTYFRRPKQ